MDFAFMHLDLKTILFLALFAFLAIESVKSEGLVVGSVSTNDLLSNYHTFEQIVALLTEKRPDVLVLWDYLGLVKSPEEVEDLHNDLFPMFEESHMEVIKGTAVLVLFKTVQPKFERIMTTTYLSLSMVDSWKGKGSNTIIVNLMLGSDAALEHVDEALYKLKTQIKKRALRGIPMFGFFNSAMPANKEELVALFQDHGLHFQPSTVHSGIFMNGQANKMQQKLVTSHGLGLFRLDRTKPAKLRPYTRRSHKSEAPHRPYIPNTSSNGRRPSPTFYSSASPAKPPSSQPPATPMPLKKPFQTPTPTPPIIVDERKKETHPIFGILKRVLHPLSPIRLLERVRQIPRTGVDVDKPEALNKAETVQVSLPAAVFIPAIVASFLL